MVSNSVEEEQGRARWPLTISLAVGASLLWAVESAAAESHYDSKHFVAD
jgi:hypothetical protein